MTTKFQTKTREELLQLSTEDLQAYTESMKVETIRLESETAAYRQQANQEELRTADLKGQLKVWKEINQTHLKSLGWEDLTDDEVSWLANGAHYEYWLKGKYLVSTPSAREVKEKYAEVMGKGPDDTMDKKFAPAPEMEFPSAWVDRSGKYHPVGLAEHDQWAWDYLNEKYGKLATGEKINALGSGSSAFEFLERAGWVKIMAWPTLPVKYTLPRKLTHAQKQTLYTYCKIYKCPLPFKDPLF